MSEDTNQPTDDQTHQDSEGQVFVQIGTDADGSVIRNEVRGQVNGTVIQIAGAIRGVIRF